MLGGQVEWKRTEEGSRWGLGGEKTCHYHNPQWSTLPHPVFAFVICLGVSSKGTKNRISHCSKRLNSLRLGSREHNNFNEIKVSQGQYLFQLILTVTHCLPGQNPRALTHIQKIAEKKDGIVGRQLPNARGASHLPQQFGSHSLRLLPDPPVRGLSKPGGTQCLSHLTAGKLRPREEE